MTEEQRAARVWHHEMETNEGIHEQSERIVSLESLIVEMWTWNNNGTCGNCPVFEDCQNRPECTFWDWVADRMRELDIEVPE